MSDQILASAIETLIGGSADTFVVCAGAGQVVAQKTATQAMLLLPTATTSTAGKVPTLGASLTASGAGSPTSAQLFAAWLGAARYAVRIAANDTSLLQTAVTGAGVAGSSGRGRTLTSGATSGAARHAWNNGGINNTGWMVHEIASKDARMVPFGQQISVTTRINITAWAATTSGYAYVFFGVGQQIGATLSNRGFGFIIDNARGIKIVAHDGTTLTTGSSVGTAAVSGSPYYETYRMVSDGAGTVSLYRDSVLLGSVSGGPTTDGSNNQSAIHVEIGNGGQSLTNSMTTGDMSISISPTGFGI
jgi:hypothetical protein